VSLTNYHATDVRRLQGAYKSYTRLNTIQITICNAPYFARRIRGAGGQSCTYAEQDFVAAGSLLAT